MRSNPFSTRFVAPGRIDWVAEPIHQISRLTDRFLNEFRARAAIIGAHGTGKSTLLEHLVPELGTVLCKMRPGERLSGADKRELECRLGNLENTELMWERRIFWLRIRRQQDAFGSVWETRPLWNGRSILVIDGYEQLPPWRRMQIVLATNRRASGLLITSHRKALLPTLHATVVTTRLARAILEQLLPEEMPWRASFLAEDRLQAMLSATGGNFREVLMQLYDDVECGNLVNPDGEAPCISPVRRPK